MTVALVGLGALALGMLLGALGVGLGLVWLALTGWPRR